MTKKELNNKTQASLKLVVRYGAFILLVLFAAYGIRHALSTLQDSIRDGLTVIFTFLLAWTFSQK